MAADRRGDSLCSRAQRTQGSLTSKELLQAHTFLFPGAGKDRAQLPSS